MEKKLVVNFLTRCSLYHISNTYLLFEFRTPCPVQCSRNETCHLIHTQYHLPPCKPIHEFAHLCFALPDGLNDFICPWLRVDLVTRGLYGSKEFELDFGAELFNL